MATGAFLGYHSHERPDADLTEKFGNIFFEHADASMRYRFANGFGMRRVVKPDQSFFVIAESDPIMSEFVSRFARAKDLAG